MPGNEETASLDVSSFKKSSFWSFLYTVFILFCSSIFWISSKPSSSYSSSSQRPQTPSKREDIIGGSLKFRREQRVSWAYSSIKKKRHSQRSIWRGQLMPFIWQNAPFLSSEFLQTDAMSNLYSMTTNPKRRQHPYSSCGSIGRKLMTYYFHSFCLPYDRCKFSSFRK